MPGMRNSYALEPLELASGSREMNVLGTLGSPKIFKYTCTGTDIFIIKRITLFILDPGTMSNDKFGALGAALTNGLKIVVKQEDGSDTKIKDIFDNVDIFMAFANQISTGETATGFLDEEDYFSGSMDFPDDDFRIKGKSADLVKIIVQDDLTAIQRLRCSVLLKKIS